MSHAINYVSMTAGRWRYAATRKINKTVSHAAASQSTPRGSVTPLSEE